MNKFTKSLLIGTITLGLLAPVSTTVINPVTMTVQAKHHHRRVHHTSKWYYHQGYIDATERVSFHESGGMAFISNPYSSNSAYYHGWINHRAKYNAYKYHHRHPYKSDYAKARHSFATGRKVVRRHKVVRMSGGGIMHGDVGPISNSTATKWEYQV